MSHGTRGVRHTSPRKEHAWRGGTECKHCPRCDNWCPLDLFSRRSRNWDGLYEICRACRSADTKSPNVHTGRPRIEHDHSTGVERKRCSTCKQWFAIIDFNGDKSRWDVLQSNCKTCSRAFTEANRSKNIEARRQYDREYSATNKVRKTANRIAWRAANLERDQANQRAWVEANRDRIREADSNRVRDPEKRRENNARWYENNKDYAIAQVNRWRLDNPELARIKGARDSAKRRARKACLPVGPWNEQEVIDRDGLVCWIKGCTVGSVALNGRRDGDIDHLIPLGAADYPDHPGDVFENVAIACSKCNREKAMKLLPEAIARYEANLRKEVSA